MTEHPTEYTTRQAADGPLSTGTAFSVQERTEIEQFIKQWMKAAREYVQDKESSLQLTARLYDGQIGIREWERVAAGQDSREDVGNTPEDEPYSDYVHTPAPIVNTWVDNAHAYIFQGPEYLVVSPRGANAHPADAMGLQKLLLERLDDGRFEARIYDALQTKALYGTVVAKMVWHVEPGVASPEAYGEPSTEQVPGGMPAHGASPAGSLPESPPWQEFPLLQVIPLDKTLPDWRATHNDVQRWRGIGHRVDRTYEDVVAGFRSGVYHLNQTEFEQRFSRAGGSGDGTETLLSGDAAAQGKQDPQRWLQLWEWHGQAATSNGGREVIAVVATDRDAGDPSGGVLIRLRPGPLIRNTNRGYRPFVVDHFTQRQRPFGLGLVEGNRDLLHTISRFVGMFIDNLHVVLNSAKFVNTDSPAYEELKAAGWKVPPGKIFPKLTGEEAPIQELPKSRFPANDNLSAIKFFSDMLERRSAQPDIYANVGSREKSATEASILQQQGQTPTEVRLRLFCKNFVNPALTMALEMLRVFSTEDQILWAQQNGEYIPLIIPTNQLQRAGEFRVMAALTRQDYTNIAKAQTLRQILQTAPVLQDMLMAEGKRLAVSNLVTQLLHLLKIDNAQGLVEALAPVQPEEG